MEKISTKKIKQILRFSKSEYKYLSPNIFKIKKKYNMFFCNRGSRKKFYGEVNLAVSKDLNKWKKYSSPLLKPKKSDIYISLTTAFFYKNKNKNFLFIEAQKNKDSDIICYVSEDLKNWSVSNKFKLSTKNNLYQSPFIYKIKNRIYLYYSQNRKIINCLILDNNFKKLKLIKCLKASLPNEKFSIYSPSIIKVNKFYYMFYAAWSNKREGNINLLKSFEKKCNYKLIIPAPLKKDNKIISSTEIRKLLSNGNLSKANKYLTRKWEIEGKVETGRRVGGKIGFATCNIDIGNYIIAKPGVYSVKVKLDNTKKKISGIANLGFRPTFNQNKILLEVNLFNFNKNIYNKKLAVEFIKFIRREKKFKSIKHLTNQIKKDIRVARISLK